MEISINDLDDDDVLEVQKDNPNGQQEQKTQNYQADDFVLDILSSKGISDPSKIKFQDDDGNIEEKDWNSLTKEEKINILNTPVENQHHESDDLTDEEIELLNQIRQSNLTPNEFITQIKGNQVVQDPIYKIDDLSDDEVFLLDLESRVGELDDDSAAQALNLAKQNEDLYKKQVDGIRKEYKDREDFESKQEQAEIEQQQHEAYNQFSNQVINAIDQFNSIGNLDLDFEESDKEELAEFILSRDEAGENYFWNALQDPETMVKAAWFILNGDEAFDNVSDYFKNQIKLISASQYKKGFEDGKNNKPTSSVFIDPSKKPVNQHRTYKSIEDLDDED